MREFRRVSKDVLTTGKGSEFIKRHRLNGEEYFLGWINRKAHILTMNDEIAAVREFFGVEYDAPQLSLPLTRHHQTRNDFFPKKIKPYLVSDINKTCDLLFSRRSKKLIQHIQTCLLTGYEPATWVSMFPDEWWKAGEIQFFDTKQLQQFQEVSGMSLKRLFNCVKKSQDNYWYPHVLDDVNTMVAVLGKNAVPDGSLSFGQIHETVVRRYRLEMAKKESFPVTSAPIFSAVAELDGMSSALGKYVIPKSSFEIVSWGEELSNCLAAYAKQMQEGRCLIVGLFNNDKIVGAAEIAPSYRRNQLIIRQCSAARNSSFHSWEEELARLLT